ncbi:MAG TPA: hypothetical protein VKI20_11350, partial [Acidimicrobiales bacterium]|nr:hypothetical protein [Acidimicrobiales bacterium]
MTEKPNEAERIRIRKPAARRQAAESASVAFDAPFDAPSTDGTGAPPAPSRRTTPRKAKAQRSRLASTTRTLMAGLGASSTFMVVGTLALNEQRATAALKKVNSSGTGASQSSWGATASVAAGAATAGGSGWTAAPASAGGQVNDQQATAAAPAYVEEQSGPSIGGRASSDKQFAERAGVPTMDEAVAHEAELYRQPIGLPAPGTVAPGPAASTTAAGAAGAGGVASPGAMPFGGVALTAGQPAGTSSSTSAQALPAGGAAPA